MVEKTERNKDFRRTHVKNKVKTYLLTADNGRPKINHTNMPLHSMPSPVYGISMADIASQIGYCQEIHRAMTAI